MWTKTYQNQTVIYEFILLRSSLRKNNDITTCLCLLRKHRKQRSHRDHWFHVEELNIPTQILDFPGSRDFEFFLDLTVCRLDRSGCTLAHLWGDPCAYIRCRWQVAFPRNLSNHRFSTKFRDFFAAKWAKVQLPKLSLMALEGPGIAHSKNWPPPPRIFGN